MTIFLAVAVLAVQVVPGAGVRVISTPNSLNVVEKAPKSSSVSIVEPNISLLKKLQSKRPDFDAHVKAGGKWIRVDLGTRKGHRQSFEAFQGNVLVYHGLASGAIENRFYKPSSHPKAPHNHLGTFWVGRRSKNYVSKLFDCPMRFCLFYCNGHAIHACQRSDIKKLGRPASHGCTRISPANAKKLFKWVGKEFVAVQIVR